MNKRLKCPNCGARLIDEAEHIKSEVKLVNQSEDWNPDYYTKCWNCKKEIGLKKLN
ncbi:MAG: hypothetical protein K0Q87_504 [Neobacillus sp.]|jgi:DNA-directed RNA polymerase subunit RPC12/RpoP|nr:hypothetical protein [Neobacillus sp.]